MDMVGRYRIDERIGEGAMSDVYRAHDPEIGRVVAIKVLKAELRRDPEVVRRFLRESKAAGMLSHANIATIYDVGEADGFPYIAMEYIEGQPLDEVLKAGGRMVSERVIRIALQLADALAYAHAQGIVHRDIKPSNIILRPGEKAKLLDFGIARIDDEDGAREEQLQRTQVGQVLGTPRYMSPEQALGLPIDARSDLFSLGVVLYEMVTGKCAFSGTGLASVAIRVAQEQPEAIDHSVKDCPKGLRFIIQKLLAKKSDQRFADGGQLHQALARELETLTAYEPARRRGLALNIKLPLILASTTAVALALCVFAVLDRQTKTIEHMALTSGSSITAFVTNNAALFAAENAGLPPEQQDWAPLQAFVDSASDDANVRRLAVVDDRGIVRAASEAALVGKAYRPPAADGHGYHFVRPIRYAGADFGKVDMVLSNAELLSATQSARNALVALSLVVLLVVFGIGVMSAHLIARPLRRLRLALDDAAAGNLAFRLSGREGGEFGRLYESFDRMAAALESRTETPVDRAAIERELGLTRIAPPAAAREQPDVRLPAFRQGGRDQPRRRAHAARRDDPHRPRPELRLGDRRSRLRDFTLAL